jgi:flagellar motor switch protein FliG
MAKTARKTKATRAQIIAALAEGIEKHPDKLEVQPENPQLVRRIRQKLFPKT